MSSLFKPLEYISSWRRISPAIWGEHTSPQVLGFDDIEMTAAQQVIQEVFEQTGERITVTHCVVRALGAMLEQNPDLNVVMVRGKPMVRKRINAFVQVAVKGKHGAGSADLSGVQIKDIDQKSILEIGQEIANRANRVRKGTDKQMEATKKLLNTVPGSVLAKVTKIITTMIFDLELDLSKYGVQSDPFGSYMVSNCSGFGVHAGFAPLIPSSRTPIIFLIGRTDDKPVARDGEVVIRPYARMCATFDHRLLDGLQIGTLTSGFVSFMEDIDKLRSVML